MGIRRLYVGRLSNSSRERDVRDLFEKYGKVVDVELKDRHGFVEFEDSKDADDAAYYLDGKKFFGERIVVEPDKYSNSSSRRDYRVYIENVSPRMDWFDIKSIFKRVGTITYGDLDTKTGEGVIEFSHFDDMEYAIRKYDGTKIDGYRVRLYESSRNPRPRSRSRSQSVKSQSRSRSRSPVGSRSRSRSPTPRGDKSPNDKDDDVKSEGKNSSDEANSPRAASPGSDSAADSHSERKD